MTMTKAQAQQFFDSQSIDGALKVTLDKDGKANAKEACQILGAMDKFYDLLERQVEAANDRLAKASASDVAMSDSGCISLKGIRRQYGGLHLYPEEWTVVFANKARIEQFAIDNAAELKSRSDANRAAKVAAKAAKTE